MVKVLKFLLTSVLLNIPTYAKGQNDTMYTFSGNGMGGFSGDGGVATNASIGNASQGCFDYEGNFYFTIRNQHRIRKVALDGTISTIAGNGTAGFSGDGSLSVNAILDNPLGICVDHSNNVYFADHGNERIRKIDFISGVITTIAGNGAAGFAGDGGQATNASLSGPVGICFDPSGNMYVADASNHRVRKINGLQIISTVAGNGTNGFSGDGQLAINAQLADPLSVICDSIGNIIICDFGNKRIRKVDNVSGYITTIAGGTGSGNYNGDNIPATSAEVSSFGIVFNSVGDLILSDQNQRIRKVDQTGIIHTIGGSGIAGYSGDGNLASLAQIYNPEGITVDSCDNVFFCDVANRRIRRIGHSECLQLNINIRQFLPYSIYPNPTTNQITITSTDRLKAIILENPLDQKVVYQKVTKGKITIDISHLMPGIYFLILIDANGGKLTKKVVKE